MPAPLTVAVRVTDCPKVGSATELVTLVTVGLATVATCTRLPLLTPSTVTLASRAVPTVRVPRPLRLTVRLVEVALTTVPVTPWSKVTLSWAALLSKLGPEMIRLVALASRPAVLEVTTGATGRLPCTSTIRLLPSSAMKRSPWASTATPLGKERERPGVARTLAVPAAFTSTIRLLKVSPMKRSPWASTATPKGSARERPGVARTLAVPAAFTSTIRLFKVSAMKRSPWASTATPMGKERERPGVARTLAVPAAFTSTIRLLPLSEMKRSPWASNATPSGSKRERPGVARTLAVPAAFTSTIRLLLESAMKRSPWASNATPVG